MNKIKLIFFLLPIIFFSCKKFDGQNGILEEFYDIGNGNALKKSAEYKDGLLDGSFIEYYINGVVKTEAHYHKGELDGSRKHFFENGQIKAEENYKQGKRNGLYKYYYKNGIVETERMFKDGMNDGTYNKNFKDGKPEFRYNYRLSKMHGENKAYYPNGQVKYIAFFDRGDPAIGLKEYYMDGSEVNNDFNIAVTEENLLALKGIYRYTFTITPSSASCKLYDGELRDDKYYDKIKYYDQLMKNDKGSYYKRYIIEPGNYEMSDFKIIAIKETDMGNLFIKTKKIRVSINNYF